MRIAIIIGSTRPGRRGAMVADWVTQVARRHAAESGAEVTYDVVDLADHDLPVLDEAVPGIFGRYENPHTQRWSATIGGYDGFVVVTPEYNHSVPASLKNALDYLFQEWNNKAAGFVSYGLQGGTRAVEHLRLVMAELQVADVRTQVALSLFHDFVLSDPTEPGEFRPGEHQEPALRQLLDEVVSWSGALREVRNAAEQVPVGS